MASALAAVDRIIDQGEGTRKSPFDADCACPAHYYRFFEIYEEHRMLPNPHPKPGEKPYRWGPPIPYRDGRSVIENPTLTTYKDGSRAARMNQRFNYTYTSLLNTLNRVFNGEQPWLRAALGLMQSLRQQALEMADYTLCKSDVNDQQLSETLPDCLDDDARRTVSGKLDLRAGPSFSFQPI